MQQLAIHLDNPHGRTLSQAITALQNGEIIVYPTDTVYGLGCSLYKKQAIENLYRLKGKPKDAYMSIICDSIQQAATYAHVSNFAFRVFKRCFPGPFTLIVEARREISRLMLTRQKEIGIRIPESPVCRQLVSELGFPLINTSVKLDGYGALEEVPDIDRNFINYVSLALYAGPLPDADESTVARLVDGEIEIIREGKGDPNRLYA